MYQLSSFVYWISNEELFFLNHSFFLESTNENNIDQQ